MKAQRRAREKYERDVGSEIAMARRESKEEGLAEGFQKGEQKGKLEERKQLALNMKSKGFDDNTIAQCLNISIDELKKLLNE